MSAKHSIVYISIVAVLMSACSSSSSDSLATDSMSDPMSDQVVDADQGASDTIAPNDGEHKHDAGHAHGAAQSGSSSNAEGLEIVLETTKWDSSSTDLKFSIVSFGDKKVIDELVAYDEVHTKQMHVTLVKHDLSEYYHVHPLLSEGMWVIDSLPLSDGYYRLVADFKVKDVAHVALGTDITVGGSPTMAMARLSQEVRTSSFDNYSISVAGNTEHSTDQLLSFTISKDGVPVSTVDEYLGSNGHLVAYDSHSLSYTHIHPNAGIMDGTITFKAPPAEHGFSKYFLEVKLDGTVRLFTFVLENM